MITWDDRRVYNAIALLSEHKRSTNHSQIARVTGLSRNRVADATENLRRLRHIKDTSKGNAYHWRTTDKPLPEERRPQ